MLKLRLSRGGTKKRPVYKVVVADSRFARDGRFIEKVGFFNPLLPKEKKERVGLEAERIKYWLGQGAQPTTRVARILGENDLIPSLRSSICCGYRFVMAFYSPIDLRFGGKFLRRSIYGNIVWVGLLLSPAWGIPRRLARGCSL